MKKHKTIMIKHPKLVSFKCDRCKKELIEDDMEMQETYSIHFTGGYSSAFGDMNIIECDLCSKCLYDLIKDFCVYNYGVIEFCRFGCPSPKELYDDCPIHGSKNE